MKTITLLLVLAFCLVSIGCNRYYEQVKVITEGKSALVEEITLKIDAAPKASGVDEARKIFEARKADLKAKWDAIPKSDLSSKERNLIYRSTDYDNELFEAIRKKHAFRITDVNDYWDNAVDAKFWILVKDFKDTFKY